MSHLLSVNEWTWVDPTQVAALQDVPPTRPTRITESISREGTPGYLNIYLRGGHVMRVDNMTAVEFVKRYGVGQPEVDDEPCG